MIFLCVYMSRCAVGLVLIYQLNLTELTELNYEIEFHDGKRTSEDVGNRDNTHILKIV